MINKGRGNVKQLADVLEEALEAASQERENAVSDRLADLVEDTNGLLGGAKQRLEELRTRSEDEERLKPKAAEGRIRSNMMQAMAKKHQQLLIDFQTPQSNYKQELEHRQKRELQILMPTASEEEVQQMIEDGGTPAMLVMEKMAGTHALLIEEVQRIKDKHQDILRLERSMADLTQMFQEMAMLVDEQGEMLDAIELNVSNTKGYTEKAEEQLIQTRKHQEKGERMMCWLLVIGMVVVLAILGPVLLQD